MIVNTRHRLANLEQTWIDKVQQRRRTYKIVQGRIKLLYKKSKLNDMIEELKTKFQRERDQGIMSKVRAELKEKNLAHAILENDMEKLRGEIQNSNANAGPEWMGPMFEDKNRVRYPNEYVTTAVNMMAKSNIDASCMPELMSETFNLWLDNPSSVPNFASGRQFRRWREGVAYLCLIHIGYLIMKHAKDATIIQDGTPDDGYHIEAFTIHTGDMSGHQHYYFPLN